MIDKLVGSDCYWKLLLSFYKLHLSDMLTQTSHLFRFNNSFTILLVWLVNFLSLLHVDPEFVKNLHYRFSQDYLNEENILDIFSGSSYKELLKPGGFLGSDSPLNLSFSFYTDGINPFKSSNKQHLWPIFLMINELPPELRYSVSQTLKECHRCQCEISENISGVLIKREEMGKSLQEDALNFVKSWRFVNWQ